MDDLKFFCKYLVVLGKSFDINQFRTAFASHEIFHINENGTHHKVHIDYEGSYIKIYLQYGNPMPHPDHVINIKTTDYENNPRAENQIEPKQMFILIDSIKSRVWLSNIKKASVLTSILTSFGLDAEIKNIYAADEFIQKIRSINGIKLSSTPESLFQLSKLNDFLNYDVYGYGSDTATLQLNYKSTKKLDSSILNNLKELFQKRSSFETFVISGKDDREMDIVFNTESLVEKIFLDLKTTKTGEYIPEDVFHSLMERINT